MTGPSDVPLDPEAIALIEGYLDELARSLPADPVAARRTLNEASDHLYADVRARAAAGTAPSQAAVAATAAFGQADEIAPLHRTGITARELFSSAWLLVAAGAIAVGVSGLLAAAIGAAKGMAFVAGDTLGITYTPERCAEYQRIFPDAGGCTQAALLDHYGEVVDQRVALGVLGVLLLIGYVIWRRRGGPKPNALLVGAIGLATFGLAALAQLAWSANLVVVDPAVGVGAPLAGGIVAAIVALACIPLLIRGIRQTSGRPVSG